jgi:positive regulator of sigma E activity
MLVFILILLLLAAIFGVLGAVLKVTAIVVLAVLLTITLLAAFGWWALKRSARKFSAQYDEQVSNQRVIKYRKNEADPGGLPPSRDDRY